jgi:hypothetical protein
MNVERYRKLVRMERDTSTTNGERDNARRLRQRMEREHPSIQRAASQAEKREQAPRESVPGPYDTGAYGPSRARPEEPPPETEGPRWGDRLRSFVQAAMDEVGTSFTISDMIRQDVEVEMRSNTRTLHVHVRIPLDALNRAADFSGGSLEEYSRLVGIYVGNHLASLLRTRTER